MNTIKVDFEKVSPSSETNFFVQQYIKLMDQFPSSLTLSFKQHGETLYVRVTFGFQGNTANAAKLEVPATNELVVAILSSFNGDQSQVKAYVENPDDLIKTDGENDNLVVEMFKAFLASPFKGEEEPIFISPDTGKIYFKVRFTIQKNRSVLFCLPDYNEAEKLYVDSLNNK